MTKSAETYRLNFHSDPGHGWLEVPLALAYRAGILDEISDYSYMARVGNGKQDAGRNIHLFLEEDCDASLFMDKARLFGWQIEFEELNVNCDHPIRNYHRYQSPSSIRQ